MFISFEGTEGVGKSTLIAKLYDDLIGHNKTVLLTREPGGTPVAEQIRSLLLSTDHSESIAHDTELLLMYAGRAQHLQNKILPALAAGQIVLCDRFSDASFAYQCAGRGLSREKLQLLNQNFVSRMPDLTFWLDAPIETGMSRARARGELDRFEQEKMDFFRRVRDGYAELHQQQPERVKRIDASQTAEQVFAEASAYVRAML